MAQPDRPSRPAAACATIMELRLTTGWGAAAGQHAVPGAPHGTSATPGKAGPIQRGSSCAPCRLPASSVWVLAHSPIAKRLPARGLTRIWHHGRTRL